jgi:hypothetical protein
VRRRAAFLGHGYHRLTLSSRFMIEELGRTRDVELHFDDSWRDAAAAIDIDALLAAGFDEIHVWQLERVAQRLANAGSSVPIVFYPMYDSCRLLGDDYWEALRGRLRVVCFCRHLHEHLRRLGLVSLWLQYWPQATPDMPDFTDLRVFWWRRRPDIHWPVIKQLMAGWPVTRLHLHEVPDPTYQTPEPIGRADIQRFGITTSTWFEDRDGLDRLLREFNLVIAPRRFEGIGFSFLEAMSRGQVVLAENQPTMNEYIVHGVNGLLYEPDRTARWHLPLTPARARDMGLRAHQSCRRGHAEWLRSLTRLEAFLAPGVASVDALLEPAGMAAQAWLPEAG